MHLKFTVHAYIIQDTPTGLHAARERRARPNKVTAVGNFRHALARCQYAYAAVVFHRLQ